MARTGVHIVLGILLWVVFGYYWYIVIQRPVTPHTKSALIAVSSIVVVITLFLIGWVFHNRRIARKHRRRKARYAETEAPDIDFLGRRFIWPANGSLLTARYIEIHVVQMSGEEDEVTGHKTFRVGDGVPE
jgi:cbb3-type cytochrome oxidase subunit 3